MIELANVTKKFGDVTAIDNLSLKMKEGVYGLIGQNGAGKSTLLRTIAGVYYVDKGDCFVNGYPCRSKEAKARLFFLPDNPYAPVKCDIQGVFDFYNAFYNLDELHFNALIKKFELPRDKKVRTFSKGMLRQLFLAITFSMPCEILLLDEAFDGLDPLVLEVVREEIMAKRNDGSTIVISSHNLSSLEKIADHFIILYKGKVSKEGENEDLSQEMIKYQAVFKEKVTEEDLEALGFYIVSFKRVGSVTNFVIKHQEDVIERIKKVYDVVLIENIPLDPEEILTLQLAFAKKEGEKHV